MEQGRPISYMALGVGHAGPHRVGHRVREGRARVADPRARRLRSASSVKTHHHGLRFVDRDQVADITTAEVHCTITDDQVDSLPAPNGPLVLHPDTAHDEGPSLTARWGRLFGREHWKELE